MRLTPLLRAPKSTFLLSVFCLLLSVTSGCKTYQANFAQTYEMGQYQQSEAQLRQEADGAIESDSNGDHLIYLLELGTVQRTLDQLDASEKSFDASDAYFQKVDQQADIRIGRAVKSTVSNLGELAYEGYGYDRIMMNAYKALNYMEQGNFNFARAELKRVANTQQQIERNKAARMKQLQEEGQQSGQYNPNALNDPGLRSQTQMLYADIPENSIQSAYLNAFAEYLQGIFLLHTGDANDREIGRTALRRTLGMVNSAYVQQDLVWADLPPDKQPPVTYVIFESGMAPMRQEIRIDVPIWVFNLVAHDTGVDYVGVAFPRLIPIPGGMPMIQANSASGLYPTEMLVNMDGVVAREFKDEMPTVIARTLIAAGAKAGLAYAANRATANSGVLNVLTRVATTAYQYSVNNADLRTWRTLPKTINVARFNTPADGKVSLLAPGGGLLATVQLNTSATNVIWVRGPGNGIVCRVFQLKQYN